jgi:ParB family chromosome partitioning protein
LARPDFRGTAARRLSEERELSPSIISLLSPEGSSRAQGVRHVPIDRIDPNPEQPRMSFDPDSLNELAASLREHGVLQPVLVRPIDGGRYQLIAGERRWRAARIADLDTVPALIEEIDDDTALEISIIENLQREDLSPLDEALMYERMTRDHGYSLRKLAQKLGKDKGYIENRLRLADAPPEIKQLVSLRKDTLSHAYELLKVPDERTRRRLAEQVAAGELSLVRLRDKVEGRRRRRAAADPDAELPERQEELTAEPLVMTEDDQDLDGVEAWSGARRGGPITDDSLVSAKGHLTDALDELVGVLREPTVAGGIGDVDRANLAKYLTIAKLKLENAIALVRSGEASTHN